MPQESLITDGVKAAIGVEVVGPPELIEMKAIKDFAKAINWPDPPNLLHVDEKYAEKTRFGGIIAPWSFYTSLGRDVPRQRLPLPPARVGMNGGNDYEHFLPIRPGDVITTRSKIVDITEREGRAGKLIFTVSERTFTNQRDEVVGIARGTGISQY
ncbi:MAG: MaoC family dehydratase N-terminal domain-containing protein [Dehalococcoidales bacterium]|nr:MaoC family dehydratase N-terminal domain-containing protein [Dehalococcoidales bacterium]